MSLNEDIVAAFADTPYPGDDLLTIYDAAGRKYDETFQLLRGRDWREMPVVEFMQGDTPLPDLMPEAFHYYLPALLLASLDETLDEAPEVASSLAFFLSPASARQTGKYGYDDRDGYDRRISMFTGEQQSMICRVLEEYVARGWESEDDVRQTIERLLTGD